LTGGHYGGSRHGSESGCGASTNDGCDEDFENDDVENETSHAGRG